MRVRPVLAVALVMIIGACSPSDKSDGTALDDGAATTVGGQAGVAPAGAPLIEGLPMVVVLGPPESDAGDVPLFRWEAVAGAAIYDVAVIGPDGPLWAWQGAETEVYLGGLPFERPPGWAGPVIAPGSCWSVVARDADGHVFAVSEFLPISPGGSPGHTCVPGTGIEASG